MNFNFNADQPHQVAAIRSVVDLFDGYAKPDSPPIMADRILPNIPEFEDFEEYWLGENLQAVQRSNAVAFPDTPLPITSLEVENGIMLEGVTNDSHSCPHFTLEMETGTGKTYVYFRTMLELYQRYGLTKYIVVVPSVAILEGVKKAFSTMKAHFQSLYGVTHFEIMEYDGSKLGNVPIFTQSLYPLVMVMTYQSFNKASNVFFKANEKTAPRKPFEWIQECRPVVILDEPQNLTTDKSREAIRTLKPLFVLRYSATHRESPNLLYRLTPVEAFRQGLVKQIEVIGISDLEGLQVPKIRLEEVTRVGRGKPVARVRALTQRDGQVTEQSLTLKQNDDLYAKTRLEAHRGCVVKEIVLGIDDAPSYVEFVTGERVSNNDEVVGSKLEVWRAQIEKTIETHLERQVALRAQGVKVLSLFFVDRVANYEGETPTIKRLFDESWEKLKHKDPAMTGVAASAVRQRYFASIKNTKTNLETFLDDVKTDSDEAKQAFKLIMQEKERLLTFSESAGGTPVAFIFAHSALREGWDNPNVFQICTLNMTTSAIKKRQEIGRGLRLCVDQEGNRPDSSSVNILTVIANESYESYVDNLQREYVTDGDSAPMRPKQAQAAKIKRNERLFSLPAFKAFWRRLSERLQYKIVVETEALIEEAVKRIAAAKFPEPMLTISKGKYLVFDFAVHLERFYDGKAHIVVEVKDSLRSERDLLGHEGVTKHDLIVAVGDELSRHSQNLDVRAALRGVKLVKSAHVYGEDRIWLSVGSGEQQVSKSEYWRFQRHVAKPTPERFRAVSVETYPIPDFIARAAGETDLTRATLAKIFEGVSDTQKTKLFKNPEGWANVFVNEVCEALADHIVTRIEYQDVTTHVETNLDELFPPEDKKPMKELVAGGSKSLYDQVQVDSTVEENFVNFSLMEDVDNIIVYFKFPPKFKIGLPRIIGNYNPDWGIIRLSEDGAATVELIRETKGTDNLKNLRFSNEARKLVAAQKYFARLGVSYHWVTAETPMYWRDAPQQVSLT